MIKDEISSFDNLAVYEYQHYALDLFSVVHLTLVTSTTKEEIAN